VIERWKSLDCMLKHCKSVGCIIKQFAINCDLEFGILLLVCLRIGILLVVSLSNLQSDMTEHLKSLLLVCLSIESLLVVSLSNL